MCSDPREQRLPEIPFDVAEWGDKPLPWPEGVFATEAEYNAAVLSSLLDPPRRDG